MTARRSRLILYLSESRDIGRSLALVVPLLLFYELVMPLAAPPVRNSAEMAVSGLLGQLPEPALLVLRRVALATLVLAAAYWFWLRRERASVARPHVILAEALGHALVLGPLVGVMVGGIGLSLASGAVHEPAWLPFLLSVGAGLWEEIVFRLGLLGGLTLVLVRAAHLQPRAAAGLAIAISALAFALYHHLGHAGEPFLAERFAFRAFAGTILGLLFVVRGLAVVVYMHVFYDVLCDLRAALA